MSLEAFLSGVNGVPIREHHWLPTRSAWWFGRDLICHSFECLAQMMRGVLWHDDQWHCPTWSEGCRCDLGSEP